MRTGVPGLDDLLSGGLMRSRTALLKGAPGTGKTTLGLQMLVEGARQFDEPGILLTFEQVADQLYTDMTGFGWDLKTMGETGQVNVIFVRPDEVLEAPGRQENRLLVNIADLVDQFGAQRVMIDSISHLTHLFVGEQARAIFMQFLVNIKKMGLTPIMTAELAQDDGLSGLDAYLVDTVITLNQHSGAVGTPKRRVIEVVKTRGFSHLGGAHPIEIGRDGVVVYPHSYPAEMQECGTGAPAAQLAAKGAESKAIHTGVAGLDGLLTDGYTSESTIMVAGLSGTYKTTLAAHFALGGDDGAQPKSLWITFKKSAAELERLYTHRGLDLTTAREQGRLHFLECTPGREPIEKTLTQAEAIIGAQNIERVVVDGLNDLTMGMPEGSDPHEAARWFLRRLHAHGVTTLLSQRLTRVTGRNPLSEIAWAELADTIVYLGLVEIESRLERVISVLKHRGGASEPDLRAIRSTDQGLCVSERFVGLSGVLDGTALGYRKAQIEQIFQPLYFIRDFLKLAADPATEPDKRDAILGNLSSEANQLIEMLGHYFDQPQPEADSKKDTPS